MFSRYNVEIGDALWTALYNHIEANLAEMTIEGVFEDEQVFAVLKNGEEYVKLNCSLNTEINDVLQEEIKDDNTSLIILLSVFSIILFATVAIFVIIKKPFAKKTDLSESDGGAK